MGFHTLAAAKYRLPASQANIGNPGGHRPIGESSASALVVFQANIGNPAGHRPPPVSLRHPNKHKQIAAPAPQTNTGSELDLGQLPQYPHTQKPVRSYKCRPPAPGDVIWSASVEGLGDMGGRWWDAGGC
ncbi:hypothetical protein NG798_26460 [Ancylothrix sp. C2]|uniref:hypothetical protein n=1 Tax=Ancylothrix sp. D3o TaxID=2953691 RepID=UPI0021BACF09|nr:hypothetical protein [Ancylothrix sp. D3o]MCT7953346.1 hypothetical protein [Ancylothrix sp. D3o]